MEFNCHSETKAKRHNVESFVFKIKYQTFGITESNYQIEL